jgi:cell wall-associated NlpC family hydrolase
LPVTAIAADYRPGDLVTWDLGNNVPHIGIVVDQKSPETGRYLVVHNIGRGPEMEDVLLPLQPDHDLDEIIGLGIVWSRQIWHIREWTFRIAAITF